ncbi:MAG: hypothetical protein WAU70_13980 [Flavobacteriales bacterium]
MMIDPHVVRLAIARNDPGQPAAMNGHAGMIVDEMNDPRVGAAQVTDLHSGTTAAAMTVHQAVGLLVAMTIGPPIAIAVPGMTGRTTPAGQGALRKEVTRACARRSDQDLPKAPDRTPRVAAIAINDPSACVPGGTVTIHATDRAREVAGHRRENRN